AQVPVVFGEAEAGERSEGEAAVGGVVVAAQGLVAGEELAVEQRAVAGLQGAAQARRKLVGIKSAEGGAEGGGDAGVARGEGGEMLVTHHVELHATQGAGGGVGGRHG